MVGAIKWTVALLVTLALLTNTSAQRTALDLVFVLDGSESLGNANFEVLKSSVLNYVLPQMGDGVLEAGLVLFSTNLDALVNLTPNPAEFQASVNQLQYPSGQTNTNIGIQWGLTVLMTTASRSGIPQVMIVVVDGVSRFPTDTARVADFTRGMGVEIYAIGVGNNVTQEELNIITGGDSSRTFNTQSFATLPSIDLQLSDVNPTPSPVTPAPTPAPTTPVPTTPVPTTQAPTTPQPTPAPTTPIPTTQRPTPSPTTPAPTPAPTTPTPTLRPTTQRPTPSPTTPRPTPAPTTPTPTLRPTTQRPTPTPTRPTTPQPSTQVTTPRPTTRVTTPRTPTTTVRAPSTPYVEPYLDAGLCEDSIIIDGIGYRDHPAEADKHIQCYFPFDGLAAAIIRDCPFGTLWNSHSRLCEPHLKVHLKHDPCSRRGLRAHPHEGNCRTFYNCENGRSVPRCCPPGFLYNAVTQGCSPCAGCTEPCPVACATETMACNKYPEFSNPGVYRKWTRDGYVLVPCENGTIFDVSSCDCVQPYTTPASECPTEIDINFNGVDRDTHKYEDILLSSLGQGGVFDGEKSRVQVMTQAGNPYNKPLVFVIYYREAEPIMEPQALLSTRLCANGGFAMISVDRDHIKVEMSSYGKTPIIVRLPTAGFKLEDEKQLMLWHIDDYLYVYARSGGLIYEYKAKVAVLPYTGCGMHLGNSEWMDGFKGTIRRAQFLRCLADNL